MFGIVNEAIQGITNVNLFREQFLLHSTLIFYIIKYLWNACMNFRVFLFLFECKVLFKTRATGWQPLFIMRPPLCKFTLYMNNFYLKINL